MKLNKENYVLISHAILQNYLKFLLEKDWIFEFQYELKRDLVGESFELKALIEKYHLHTCADGLKIIAEKIKLTADLYYEDDHDTFKELPKIRCK